ncbi:MAG: hypothetical protein IPL28_19695 [Chloroflexi bacterium]|nr:hypothetical protein [Chloroflexota bacterium]
MRPHPPDPPPADQATGVGLTPTLSWSAVAETDEYTVEIATDAGFGNLVYTATVTTTSHPVGASLSEATTYFWRVTAANGCGASAASVPFSFTTVVPPTYYGVQLSADEAQTVVPSETITYTVSITNTGDVTDTFDLAVGGNTWTTTLSVPTIELAAAEMGNFEVVVAVPAGAWAGEEDVATVTAVSQADNAASDAVVLTSTAEAVYGFDWSAEAIAREGEAGESITYTIRLTNTGNTTNTYAIALAGTHGQQRLSLASLPLAPGHAADVAVVVVIDSEAVYPATDAVTVDIASEGDGTVSAELVLITAVAEPSLPPQMAIYLPLVIRP